MSFDQQLVALDRLWVKPDNGRYYHVRVQHDLLGDLTLVAVWGNLRSHLGGQKIEAMASLETVQVRIEQIAGRRKAHGYCLQ